jgi:hypothetical protein
MKTLRTLFWFAFFSLLWARIGVSIDRSVGDFWVALLIGALCSGGITGAAMCFASAFFIERRHRRELRETLVRRMNEDTAAAQREAEQAAARFRCRRMAL